MGFLDRFKPKPSRAYCPTCGCVLSSRPTRKTTCPDCGSTIRVRAGQLVTEDMAATIDWAERLEDFGVTQRTLERTRAELTKKFGAAAGVNDAVWSILNQLAMSHHTNPRKLSFVRGEQVRLMLQEDRDPTHLLFPEEEGQVSAEKRSRRLFQYGVYHEYVRWLRRKGRLDEVEDLLLTAEPTPAVLDELRMIASLRARDAQKNKDWKAIIRHLEGYSKYAKKHRRQCIRMVNAEPPDHTATDKKRLAKARAKIAL